MREKVFRTLEDIKFKEFYIDFLVSKFQRKERNFSIALALVSSGSVATWAIWQMYPWVWALLIALSQVASVIKPYFPFTKYVKGLHSRLFDVKRLALNFEKLYYQLTHDQITENESEADFWGFKEKLLELFHLPEDLDFSEHKDIIKKAEAALSLYLRREFDIDPKDVKIHG